MKPIDYQTKADWLEQAIRNLAQSMPELKPWADSALANANDVAAQVKALNDGEAVRAVFRVEG